MGIESANTVPKLYYYITPLFILLDYFGGINLRTAVLDSMPLYKKLYYGFCIFCAACIYLRPGLSAFVALFESTIIVLMTILSVFLPYVRYLKQADDILNANLKITNSFGIPGIVNLLLAGTIAIFAFHSSLRELGISKIHPHSNNSL